MGLRPESGVPPATASDRTNCGRLPQRLKFCHATGKCRFRAGLPPEKLWSPFTPPEGCDCA
eukprot:5861094-Pyramimonas_sp.AAC.1